MTGSPFSWGNRNGMNSDLPLESMISSSNFDSSASDQYVIESVTADYLGGHPLAVDKREYIDVFLYNDRIEIEGIFWPDRLVIPYYRIQDIQNSYKEQLAGFLFIGPIGTWWKDKHIYTVLKYKDEISEKSLVLEFRDRDVDRIQGIIYNKIVEFKRR